jgi:hypothetical protein
MEDFKSDSSQPGSQRRECGGGRGREGRLGVVAECLVIGHLKIGRFCNKRSTLEKKVD